MILFFGWKSCIFDAERLCIRPSSVLERTLLAVVWILREPFTYI